MTDHLDATRATDEQWEPTLTVTTEELRGLVDRLTRWSNDIERILRRELPGVGDLSAIVAEPGAGLRDQIELLRGCARVLDAWLAQRGERG